MYRFKWESTKEGRLMRKTPLNITNIRLKKGVHVCIGLTWKVQRKGG